MDDLAPADSMSDAELADILNGSALFQELARKIIEDEQQKPYRKLFDYYPDEGPLRRELYGKHMEFFSASKNYTEISIIAANRSGKSLALGYTLVCHMTGRYPSWWPGRKFDGPITCWLAGEDAKTVRDSMQEILFGKPGMMGTGLIPLEDIDGKPAARAGVPEGIDSALIRHRKGGTSRLVFKTYDQGRESFQAAKVDVLGFDEEPPADIYSEGLTRTMSTDPSKPNGLVLSAFTPMGGISTVVLMYLPGGKVGPIEPSRYVVTIGWNDVPHLSDKAKAAILSAYPATERDARSKGIPSLGAGAIYPVNEADLVVAPFELPGWYRCVYGMDVGWDRTAAIWGAIDPEDDILYLYSEHYMSQDVPAAHAAAIMARGKWIPGVIDPAARGRSQHDGQRLFDAYVALGMNNLTIADNAVSAGIHQVWTRMAAGRLKVFATCQNWLAEFRIYRRDDKGHVVKEHDHLMDACFAGETFVKTKKGLRPIASLVGTRGFVRTVDNKWARYEHCRQTAKNHPLVTVCFEDGFQVRCTPDHRFLTVNGWCPALDLTGAYCYLDVSKGVKERLPWLITPSPSSRTQFRSFWASGITSAVSTFRTTASDCIAWFGRRLTDGLYPQPITSTTRTKTAPTISRTIWKSFLWRDTCHTIRKNMHDRYRRTHLSPPPSGTQATQALHGTRNITKSSRIDFINTPITSANSVVRNLARRLLDATVSVLTPARHAAVSFRAWMTLSVLASNADRASALTGTPKPRPADKHVEMRCLAVLDEENRADVYCLSVPSTEIFTLANGVLVHNCRYLVMSGLGRARSRPPETWDVKKKQGHQYNYNPMDQMYSGAA